LGTCGGQSSILFAQADPQPRLSFHVLGDPLPDQWQATAIRVQGHVLTVSGTELERSGHPLAGRLVAQDSSLAVQLCEDVRQLTPTDSVVPTQRRVGSELRNDAPTDVPGDSVGPKWRRVAYEFSIAPLRPGSYTLTVASCGLEGEYGVVDGEPFQITVP
jgi:hypothetical protein